MTEPVEPIKEDRLKKIADLQLKIAVINGESWAIKHALNISSDGIDINVGVHLHFDKDDENV